MGTKKEYTSDFKITFCAITDASFVSTWGVWSNWPMASFLYITWVRWVLAWGKDCLSGFTTRGQVILDFYVLLTDVCQQTNTVSTFFDQNWKNSECQIIPKLPIYVVSTYSQRRKLYSQCRKKLTVSLCTDKWPHNVALVRADGRTDGLNQSYSCLVAAKNTMLP